MTVHSLLSSSSTPSLSILFHFIHSLVSALILVDSGRYGVWRWPFLCRYIAQWFSARGVSSWSAHVFISSFFDLLDLHWKFSVLISHRFYHPSSFELKTRLVSLAPSCNTVSSTPYAEDTQTDRHFDLTICYFSGLHISFGLICKFL